MRYIHVRWLNSGRDDPYVLMHEIDDRNWEQRRIELYRDGSYKIMKRGDQKSEEFLSFEEFPTNDEILSENVFQLEVMSSDEFQKEWKARGGV